MSLSRELKDKLEEIRTTVAMERLTICEAEYQSLHTFIAELTRATGSHQSEFAAQEKHLANVDSDSCVDSADEYPQVGDVSEGSVSVEDLCRSALWPLSICVHNEPGRWAEMTWQKDDQKLLLSAFTSTFVDSHFSVQVSLS